MRLRKLTRAEIESCGAAMPETMAFHDKLIGAKLLRVTARRGYNPQTVLHLEHGVTLSTQFDDEGNPGQTEWEITDAEGRQYRSVQIRSLRGKSVASIGYFGDPENDLRPVIPYVEFAGQFCVCATCPAGGAVIVHHRAEQSRWDLFCELKPKPRKGPNHACYHPRP